MEVTVTFTLYRTEHEESFTDDAALRAFLQATQSRTNDYHVESLEAGNREWELK